MKLLLDQNLSWRLLSHLEAHFGGSSQVRLLGLEASSDNAIWQYAKDHGFAIVTKDADFAELSFLRGVPPKIIWLNCGNVSNTALRVRLLGEASAINAFLAADEDGVFQIE